MIVNVISSALALSVIATTCSSMTNCRDIDRHKFLCLPFSVRVEKAKNKKGLDSDCNCMVPNKRRVTRILALSLQQG